VRANLRINSGQVEVFIVATISGRDAPTTIVTAMFPSVDRQVIVLKVIVLAINLFQITLRAATSTNDVFHKSASQIF
jgi:hypothetical protein